MRLLALALLLLATPVLAQPAVDRDLSSWPDVGVGPSGVGIIPFDGTATKDYQFARTFVSRGVATVMSTKTFAMDAHGSGLFGPNAADFALIVSSQKRGYETSIVEGEIDGLLIATRQGKKGDTGALILDVTKRRDQLLSTAPDETGGAAGTEMSVTLEDAAGNWYHRMHALVGFAEVPGGPTGGRGAGTYMESRGGIWGVGHWTGSIGNQLDEHGVPMLNGWRYAFAAGASRDWADSYWAVDGDKGDIPGRTRLGTPATGFYIRPAPGRLAFDNSTGAEIANLSSNGNLSWLGEEMMPYTATAWCTSGKFAGDVLVDGRTTRQGRLVFLNARIYIPPNRNGNCSGRLLLSLPTFVSGGGGARSHTFATNISTGGQEMAGTSIAFGSQSQIVISRYDGSYPGGDNTLITLNGFYQE